MSLIVFTVSFKIIKVNQWYSMKISFIPHCPYFPPAVTISELQYISSVISITISPCNTGQCEEGAAILSILITHQTWELCCPQSSPSLHPLAWAAWRWSPASQSQVWVTLWSPVCWDQHNHQWPSTPEDRVISIHVVTSCCQSHLLTCRQEWCTSMVPPFLVQTWHVTHKAVIIVFGNCCCCCCKISPCDDHMVT